MTSIDIEQIMLDISAEHAKDIAEQAVLIARGRDIDDRNAEDHIYDYIMDNYIVEKNND